MIAGRVFGTYFLGIIIDKFMELKEEYEEVGQDQKNFCFICGLKQEKLEKGGNQKGFKHHIKHNHYMWNYVFYIAYLKKKVEKPQQVNLQKRSFLNMGGKSEEKGLEMQQQTKYNGNEMYIWNKIANNDIDISWFPIERAQEIEGVESGAGIKKGIQKEFANMED